MEPISKEHSVVVFQEKSKTDGKGKEGSNEARRTIGSGGVSSKNAGP
jgi:hypothetical protein